MLQRTAVLPGTLSLLKNLIGIPDFKDYYLVGGTVFKQTIRAKLRDYERQF